MKHWLFLHAQALRQTITGLCRTPFNTVFNALVIGIAIALPLGLFTVIQDLRALAGNLHSQPQVTIFMQPGADRAATNSTAEQLRQLPMVREITLIPRETALAQLKHDPKLGDILATLPDNPLPDALVVLPRDDNPATLTELAGIVAQWPGIDHVQEDSAWARRLHSLLAIGTTAIQLLAVLLGTALVIISSNTIRLQILTRREEIEISQHIGATHSFIRRPFLHFGVLQGLLGGLAACGIVTLATAQINPSVAAFAQFYGERFQFGGITLITLGITLGIAAALGGLGAWIAVWKHLRELQPR
jgi:cell division transport system permease protein